MPRYVACAAIEIHAQVGQETNPRALKNDELMKVRVRRI